MLIQTIGRAARNINGVAILYADKITDSLRWAIDEKNLDFERAAEIRDRIRELKEIRIFV